MPTTLDDLPSVPLPDAYHQQVRALLVREARPAPVRRWVVPVAVAASVTVVLAASQLLGSEDGTTPATAPQPPVDCALGVVAGDATDVPDAWRLMSDDPGDLQVTSAVRLEPTTCPDQPVGRATDRPVQAFAAIDQDGTVRSAVTIWTDAPAPDLGPGTEAVVVRGVDGRAQVGTTTYGTERVWWAESGRDLSVSATGLDRAELLALVERIGADGTLPPSGAPDGMSALQWEEAAGLEPYEPEWSATYVVPGSDADPQVEPRGIGVSVSRTSVPWQAELSQWPLGGIAPKVVDVDGREGVLFSNGGPDLWLRYSLGDGVQAMVSGVGDEATGGALDFAATLVPVPADDPRIVMAPPPTP